MDLSHLAQQKMIGGDRCLSCLLGSIVVDEGNSTRVIVLVESSQEHALLLYQLGQMSTKNPADLRLHCALPISTTFKFTIEPAMASQTDNVVPMRIVTDGRTCVLELPHGEEAGRFLTELKQACAAQSQRSSQGLPPSYSWVEKYVDAESINPFLDDKFDPFNTNQEKRGLPLEQLLMEASMGNSCPVVYADGTVERSPSLQGLHEEFTDSWSSQSSLTGVEQPNKGLDPMRKSHEKSLDDLGNTIKGGKPIGGRENLIKLIMRSKEEDYVEEQIYRVFCGTWNVNGQPASAPIDAWLSCDGEPPDIYAIGFQELDLSKNAYIFAGSAREEEWYRRVREALHPKAKYKRVKLVRLVGMMLIVFIQEKHKDHVYDVVDDMVGTGILGMLGNKGGVGVRFGLHDTTICFVNSHLAAHVEEYEHRNQDFRNITARMNFGNKTPPLTISDHDQVFWIGDLNYRLSDIDNDEVKSLIGRQDFQTLMGHDQLCRQMAQKKVFLDYIEGRINFIPTYKFDTGTDNWDTSEKCRVPAWCDRVLWRGSKIQMLSYRSHPVLKLSDHKPVSALFDATIKVINREKYRRVYEDVMKKLDRWENEFLPQVQLTATDVHFKDVKFIEPRMQTITIRNTGQVPVQYEFINKLNEASYCKPWLLVRPNKHIIDIKESSDLVIEVYVDKMTAPALNKGVDHLEDILVMHLEGGKDLFISVSGNFVPSSFGSSIEELVYMFSPIREVDTATLLELGNSDSSPPYKDRPLDVPKEIWYLMDNLYRRGMQTEDLFQMPGLHREIQQIRDTLDTGSPLQLPGTVHSVAEALLVFLEALAEPVIPYNLYTRCLDCCSNYTLCKQVLAQMPVSHRNVLKYICAFLRKLLLYTANNNLDIKFLATLFGRLILRPPPGVDTADGGRAKSQQQLEERKKAAFIYHLLTNEYDE